MKALFFWFLCFSATLAVFAHDPGLSTLTARLHPEICGATLVLSVKDAALLTDEDMGEQKLRLIAPQMLEVLMDGLRAKPDRIHCHIDGSGNAVMEFQFSRITFTNISFRSTCLARLPLGHRQFVSIRKPDGQPIATKLLTRNDDSLTVELDRADAGSLSPASSLPEFLMLGVKHILTGYDHLLFLFSLLVVSRTFFSALKIITCFTAAHSITLALAASGAIQIPSRIVEPIIAASILYVGVENLVRRDPPKGRGWLTFAFGLVHGLGFASVLRELGVGSTNVGVIKPLLSFNLGVELGQLFLAAVCLPIIWKLSAHSNFGRRWMPACSALVALLGGYWFVQRLLV